MHRRRMALFGLVILMAGAVIGGASTAVYLHDRITAPPPGPGFLTKRMLAGLEERLELSPEQSGKIKPIVEKRFQIMQELQEEFRPKFGEQFRLMHEEILAQLDGRQKQKWEQDLKRMQEHWPRGMRGGPRGPGGSRGSGGPGGFRGPGGQFRSDEERREGFRGPGGQFRPDEERREGPRRPFPERERRPFRPPREQPNAPSDLMPPFRPAPPNEPNDPNRE